MIRGDRIFGTVMIVIALGYVLSAYGIETSFMSDPVGPRVFPYLIALVMIVCSLVMVLRPDPEADWPAAPMLLQLGIAFAVLVAYAYAITPLGFILPTAIASGVLCWQIAGKPLRAAITGAGLGVGLWVLFRLILGLGLRGLPAGWGF